MRRLVLAIAAAALLAAPTADAATSSQVKRALAREMARAGSSSGAYVMDLSNDRELFASKADVARMPASVNKLYTTAGTLLRYGVDGTLTTSVLAADVPDDAGTIAGNLVLRGGGDPTFNTASMTALAKRLAASGLKRVTGGVIGDESAFDGRRGVPSSSWRLTSEVGGSLSALSYNRGRGVSGYQSSPALAAAQAFQRALQSAGVKLGKAAHSGSARESMVELDSYESPPVSAIVRMMNQPSDNYIAEMLIKGLGANFGSAGTTTAGGGVIREALEPFEIAPKVVDGSGLSRQDRTTPREVVGLLDGIAETEAAVAFADSLAIVGRNGTVAGRMRGTPAQDRCQAKTGTLHDVTSLAGYCKTTGGERVAFAFLMNRISPSRGRYLQDRMTAALARYDAPST